MSAFPLLDQYMGTRLQVDLTHLPSGQTVIVESERRLKREESYGFVHALWWVWLADGRSAVSVPPGTGNAVAEIVSKVQAVDQMFEPGLAERLRVPIDDSLLQHGMAISDRRSYALCFGCNGALLQYHKHKDRHRLVDDRFPPAEGLQLPSHCLPDGIVYGVVAEGRVASVAYAHRTGLVQGQVADLAVETAPGWRRRGYAKAVVSAVVAEIVRNGGEAIYCCGRNNLASAATARSVGFLPYAKSLTVRAPATDL